MAALGASGAPYADLCDDEKLIPVAVVVPASSRVLVLLVDVVPVVLVLVLFADGRGFLVSVHVDIPARILREEEK